MSPPKSRRDKNGRFVARTATKTSTPTPASSKVINTAELLEKILLCLPMQCLLLMQRVCKTWHALILSSIHLQRALFLLPASCGAISYLDWRLDDKDLYGAGGAQLGLGEHLRGTKRDGPPRMYKAHWGRTRDDAGQYRVFANPLLAKCFPFISGARAYWQEKLEDLPEPMQRAEASWRAMFFTQPPVNCLAIEWDSEGAEPAGEWMVTLVQKAANSLGLRMEGLLLRLIAIGRPSWIQGQDAWEESDG
ncbi:hypothetical protein LTR36_009306 [Oleoguttula mirabilis]|uniref:F-box domain-containing protein n=1 Tax=Oleoguttula mirabilis TaxID=1507867 RepID=A0AAV9J638_9PEZI|nr:hypothetical protein LTR36_009306 [Oleoguttula mirabilis]